ncbi:MAG: response regulator [Povalibacter sp.]
MQLSQARPSILIVDEDQSVRTGLCRLLAIHGYQTYQADSHASALVEVEIRQPDVVIIDLHLTASSGLEIARSIKRDTQLPKTRLIALSATIPEWDEAMGIFEHVLGKPCLADDLLAAIDCAKRAHS